MNIKNIANDVIFKLIAGIVLAGAMVLSMVYFAGAFHDYLNQFTNAHNLELIFFGAIFIAAAIGIYFLLRGDSTKKTPAKYDQQNYPLSVDLQMLAIKFIEGFIEGALKPKGTEPQKNSDNQNLQN